MFGRYILALLFCVTAAAGVADAAGPKLEITVEPEASAYLINIGFRGDDSGTTQIQLPNEWGGQRELYRAIRDISVSAGAVLADSDKPFIKTISHRPGQTISLRYRLVQDFTGPLRNENRYRPLAGPDHIHWIGNTVWVLPEWDEQTDVDVSIEWKQFPRTWTIANSFAVEKSKQAFSAKLQELRAAVFIAGDFRIIKTLIAGNAVHLAVRGEWQFKDNELAEMTSRMIQVERDFFADHSQKYYLVTLVPIDGGPNSISIGGTGLTDSFALFATANAGLDRFRRLLAHEYAHNWIPGKLVRMPAENEQAFYWFSEGFTDFYTLRLLYRGRLITRDEFVSEYNGMIREYYMLPVRNASNDRIVKDFWSDMNVQRLPYLRGFMFATNLDAEIARTSEGRRSLDDLIRELLANQESARQEVSYDFLTATFAKHLGRDAMPDVRRYLMDGELIVPAADALGAGIFQETVGIPVFELGFNFDKFAKDRIVADVDPESAAYAAGLRNGQRRNGGVSLSFGDTTKEIELKVKDGEEDMTIRYLPVARQKISVPQYKVVR